MRAGKSLSVSSADIRRLKAVVQDRNAPQKHVWRAEIVLLTADGVGTNEIMRRTAKSKTCVWRWQERFLEDGFDGLLRDNTRPSRIKPLRAEATERVVALDAWRPAWWDDPLDRSLDGEGGWAQREFGPTHLARPWSATAPDAPVQAVQRSALSSTNCATSSGSMSIRPHTPGFGGEGGTNNQGQSLWPSGPHSSPI